MEENKSDMSAAARLLTYVQDRVRLWHSRNGTAFATVKKTGENLDVRTGKFKQMVRKMYLDMVQHNDVAGTMMVDNVLGAIEAIALTEGPTFETYTRTAFIDDELWVDLGTGQYVHVTCAGWRIVKKTPVKFVRYGDFTPLPEPERGTSILELKEFILLPDDDHFKLVLGFMVGAYLCRDQYPILQVNGPYGASKSSMSKFIRGLIDPSLGDLAAPPTNKRDLIAQVTNNHVLAFDNMRSIPNWLSDTFCQLCTGITFSTRALYTQKDLDSAHVSRPLILNGIEQFAEAPDLMSRTLQVALPVFDRDDKELTQKALGIKERYTEMQPGLLGGLFDLIAYILENKDDVVLEKAPRLIKLALFMAAGEPFLGWEEGTWINVAMNNSDDQFSEIMTNNVVAAKLLEFMQDKEYFEGTMADVLRGMVRIIPLKDPSWPKTGRKFGNEIRKVENELLKAGLVVRKSNRSADGQRFIIEWIQT